MATRPAQTEPDLTGDTRVPAPVYKYILFEVVDSIARLTLNHAPHNVLTVPMMKEMAEAIESLNGRADVKAILLQSGQQAFSAGISLRLEQDQSWWALPTLFWRHRKPNSHSRK